MKQKELKIVIVGVGGQGILLASRILGAMAQRAGQDVKVSEVHGMSQRGGSVITHVVIAEKVFSPLVERGQADYLLAFEQMEAARALGYLKEGGVALVNSQKISPMPVIVGAAQYPSDLLDKMSECALAVDALTLAMQAGSPRAVNVVLLGMLAHVMGEETALEEAMKACVPPRTLAINQNAFSLGLKAAQKS